MIELDAYDKKILEVLIKNSREQISTIGKKVRLKRENVNYKINRMVNYELIKGYNMIINEKLLELTHYTVFIELINLKEDSEKHILKFLETNNYMSWIGTAAGKWSLIFDVVLPEHIELNDAMKELFGKFGKFIGEYAILRMQDAEYYNLKPLGQLEKTYFDKNKRGFSSIDKRDMKILLVLNDNAKTNYVDMSRKVGLTPNGIVKRVRNLEKVGVIEGYTVSIDWKKLGFEWFGLQLKLTKFNKEINKELEEYLRVHKKIIFYNKYLGGIWDYDIGLIVKNSDEVRDFINDFRAKFSDTIRIHDVFLVLGEVTGFKLPSGVFGAN